MSIQDLCDNDTIVKQTETATTGTSFGVAESYADTATLDCLVQEMSADEILQYAARGMEVTHFVYFSTDPGISNQHRLKWSGERFLRVRGAFKEGRPGESLLWIVLAEEVTTRHEV